MTLQTTARSLFNATITGHPELVVTVVSGTETCSGIRSTAEADASLTMNGEEGQSAGLVRVDASALTEPAKGASITVGGAAVFVQETRLDAAGALLAIRFSKQRPYEG